MWEGCRNNEREKKEGNSTALIFEGCIIMVSLRVASLLNETVGSSSLSRVARSKAWWLLGHRQRACGLNREGINNMAGRKGWVMRGGMIAGCDTGQGRATPDV